MPSAINWTASFLGHPFKVIADDKMEVLINSVKESGVITPVLFRPSGENHYEMYPVIGECMRHVKQDFLQCGTRGSVARPLKEGAWKFLELLPQGNGAGVSCAKSRNEKSNNPNLPQR